MTRFEKLKSIIKSKKYIETFLGTYYNGLLHDKRLTIIDYDYISYSNILYCTIALYKNKIHKKTFTILIKLK